MAGNPNVEFGVVGSLPKEHVRDLALAKTDEEKLKFVINHKPKEEDYHLHEILYKGKTKGQINFSKRKTFVYRNYIKGVLDKLIGIKKVIGLRDNNNCVTKQVEFYSMIGLCSEDIAYILFSQGYTSITVQQIQKWQGQAGIQQKIDRYKQELAQAMDKLKQDYFQDQAIQVLAHEKEYLAILLDKLEGLKKELADCDPSIQRTEWKRLNNCIRDIMEQAKSMHGIDLRREGQVKVEMAMALGEGKKDDFPTLPNPEPYMDADAEMIERKVLR